MRVQFLSLACVLAGTCLQADTFSIAGNLDPANNTADVLFTVSMVDANTTTVHLEITNTSTQGQVSGFVFNTPGSITTLDSMVESGGVSNWFETFDPDSINTPQAVGLFDVCGESSNASPTNCNGGGGVINQIGVGETGIFNITFSGDNTVGGLTATSFLSLFSTGTNGQYFALRFQSTINPAGSDVGIPTGPPVPPQQIPEPASVLLLGAMAGTAQLLRKLTAAALS